MNLPYGRTVGVEMTFIPRRPNHAGLHELSGREADKLARRFNKLLVPINQALKEYDTFFWAKADPFRWNDDGNFVSYAIEVVNGPKPPGFWCFDSTLFLSHVKRVFGVARSLGLAPRIIKRRGDTDIYVPSGGCHLHLGLTNLLPHATFLKDLDLLESHIYTDYANRPYIRWLFSEWFDEDTNCVVGWKPDDSSSLELTVEGIREYGIRYQHAILPRFSGANAKAAYPTYEFRFFDEMVANERELTLIVRFLEAWIASLRAKTLAGEQPVVTINEGRFSVLRDTRHAWREITGFLKSLDLNPADYRPWFNRCYVPRMKWGKMT